LAIVQAMEALENTNIDNSRRRIATIYTDSKVTNQSIKNYRNHKSLIEKIRKKALELEKKEWTIQITWIKAHVGHYGNELADNLVKEATKNKETIYKKIPKSQIVQQVTQQSIEKWQTQWEQTTKGLITKQFLPNIKERLRKRIQLTSNLTAIVRAHGKTNDSLHRFKITDSSECPCGTGNQTVEHLIYECPKLQRERERSPNKKHRKTRYLAEGKK